MALLCVLMSVFSSLLPSGHAQGLDSSTIRRAIFCTTDSTLTGNCSASSPLHVVAGGGGGGSSTLATSTGSATQVGNPAGTYISSPTAVINFDSTMFKGQLAGGSTGFFTLINPLPLGITGNAATVTTNANLTGDVTSVGNATTASAVQNNITAFGSAITLKSTETIQGNAFSVGNTTFSVAGGSATVAYQMTAGSFSGNGANLTSLTGGNVVGAVGSATNIAGGAVGQVQVQSGSGATTFIPAPALGGIYVGNATNLIPSTATFTGTANQVTITQNTAPDNITLSLPATINVNTTGNATTATNIQNGAAGQVPFNTGSSATSFLPQMSAANSFIHGPGPSTGTIVVSTNIVQTNVAAGMTLDLAQQPTVNAVTINGGSSNTVLGLNSSSQTVSFPQMALGGIIIGQGVGIFPSTGTLIAGSNITITNSGAPAGITIAASASGGGGSSTLAVSTGTPTQMGSPAGTFISSPTAVIDFDSSNFMGLKTGSTAYMMIGAGGVSTYTASGLLFWQSSSTISGSSYTTTTSLTQIFSTFTLTGNTLTVGHDITVECVYQNSPGSPGGAEQFIDQAGSTRVTAFDTTAGDWIRLRDTFTLSQVGQVEEIGSAHHNLGNVNGADINVAFNNGSTSTPLAFDATASQTFHCDGFKSSGGTVNFLWMKVFKDAL